MKLNLNLALKLGMVGILAFPTVSLFGCGGGGARTIYNHRLTTVGQELTDLKAAKDNGAISEEDYESQREKILKGKE